ncbi:Hypothetical protein R9X50_00558300 [Acrodontium crateriforme]|uniref:Uncharacterized protein n=1 Tax=Acrodontium crateriforme TaxID=150365 RepID=A0AAQ3RBM8_9PEZI|nr:Hypothetical protein R9X50_00558300 [Acrodontium crateriforme]
MLLPPSTNGTKQEQNLHGMDKEFATFVGRPPQLCGKYCVTDLPLDVSEFIVTDSLESFEAAKAQLDSNGWSRAETLNPAYGQRVQYLLTMLREEVLELLLGPSLSDVSDKAKHLLSRLTQTWDSVPHREFEPSQLDSMRPHIRWIVLGTRLDYLYSQFLLFKLLISQSEEYRDNLIDTLHVILRLTMSNWKRNDSIYTRGIGLEWTLVFYAMPCASILALELFRHDRQLGQSPKLDRSAAIQDISLLISCCESLAKTGQSNNQIYKQAQRTFVQCLDQILNRSAGLPGSSGHQIRGTHSEGPLSWDPLDHCLAELYPEDPEWSAWLETFSMQVE